MRLVRLLCLLTLATYAPHARAAAPKPAPADAADTAKTDAAEEAPVVTQHELRLDGKLLKYTVTTGLMPLKNEEGDVEARIFYMAYALERTGGPETRPLMFSFNGGPGSSSVWLHLGALGPKRVAMEPDGSMPAPPYKLIDNPHTWLGMTDLVFIDPVGTGYSRPAKPELGKKYWSLKGDIESVGEFMRLYLTRHERWTSPLFLVGESYGTTRAAGLSGYLQERHGMFLNGLMLVSSILNFQTARFAPGNDLPYPLFLPTYTATAFHHHALADDLQRDLGATLAEVEAWAAGEYTQALAKGDRLTPAERQAVVERLARYTGLSAEYVGRSDLRVEIGKFRKELLRARRRSVGRLDSRFLGIDPSATDDRPDFDPSLAAIRPPYTAAFNDYVRRTLGYKTDLTYHILGGGIATPWDFGPAADGYPDTSEALRDALARNPDMRVYVASGYFDLATPYFATQYTLAHMGLDPSERARIHTGTYEAGHMMYIHEGELAKLQGEVAAFVKDALAPR